MSQCRTHLDARQDGCFECEIIARYPGAPAALLADFERRDHRRPFAPRLRAVLRRLVPYVIVGFVFTGYLFIIGFITHVTTL